MTFSPQLFLSNLQRHDGPAKTNRFQVLLPIPEYIGNFISIGALQQILDISGTVQDFTETIINGLLGDAVSSGKKYSDPQITRYLGLQCESTSLPGVSLATADVKIYGPIYKVPYQKDFNNGSIDLSFICTNDFYERKLFDRWIEAIMPPDTNNLRFPKGRDTKYLTDITIMQFDEFVKQIYAIKLIDAFPISVAPMSMSWSDDSFHRLSVSFAFHRYETIYKGNYNIGQAIASGVGTVFDRFLNDFRQSIIT